MANYDGSLVFDTKIDTSGMQNGLGKLGSVAKAGAQVAVTAIAAIGTALVGASAAAIKFGAEFEQSAAKASTLFGDVAVDTANLNSKILELSSSTGVAATELNEALYSALSAGIPATEDMADATMFLESSTKLAKAGFTDIDTALSATAKTLNAYGMDVSETDKIQGILIQTQNKGITTVNELGASLAQVTPTAAAFGVSFENVGAALATMTAQGTPTAQATTQLNSLIAELGKSGTIAAKNLEKAAAGSQYAGKSFSEMMDSGASLNDVLSLMQKMADKSGLKMVDLFSSIEAGKSAMSIATKSGTVFNDNLKAMANTAGVVDEAYEKVTDTFEGQSAKMIQSAKNLGIAFYDNLKTPLKEAAKEGAASLDALSKSISSGALKPSMDKLGQAVASLVSEMIELATNAIPVLVNAFSFIVEHGNLIISVLAGMTAAMVAFKATMVISDLIAAWTSAVVAVDAYIIKMIACTATQTLCTAQLTLGQIAVGVLTHKIGLATAAQMLWNGTMLANPTGIVIAVIAGLVAALGVLMVTQKKQMSETELLNKRLADTTAKVKEQKQAYDELKTSKEEQVQSDVAQIDNAMRLYGELQKLVDAQGNVLQGNKDRVAFIVDQVNAVMPGAIKWIDDERIAYDNVSESLDLLMQKERAKVILDSQKQGYDKAINNIGEAQNTVYRLRAELVDQNNKLRSRENELEEAKIRLSEAVKTKNQGLIETESRRVETIKKLIKEEENRFGIITKELADADSVYLEYYTNIQKYEEANEAFQSGNAEKIKKINDEVTGSFKTASKDSVDALKRQVIDTETEYAILTEKHKMGAAGATEEAVEAARIKAEDAKSEFVRAGGMFVEGMAQGVEESTTIFEGSMEESVTNGVDAARRAGLIHSPSQLASDQVGLPLAQGIAEGIKAGKSEVVNAAADVVRQAIVAARTEGDMHSPSKESAELVGEPLAEGVAVGIENATPEVEEAAEAMVDVVLTAQEKYTNEQKRIEEKRAAQSAAASEKEYQERLKNAKKSTEKEKIKQERILQLAKEADDKYLQELKDKADKENEARDNELQDLKYQLDMREITEDEYYNRLAEFRDKHFKEGSKEWRSYNKEVVDYNLNSMLRNLKNSLDMHVITEAEYYKELESYRDQYFQEGSQEWQSYTQEIYNYNQSILENVKSSVKATWDEIAQQAASQSEAVASSIQNMSQKLKDYGGSLFETSTITFKGEGPGYVLNENGAYQMVEDRVITQSNLRDLTQDIDTLKDYESALMGVKKRNEEMFGENGVPDGFFEMMRSMSVEDGLAFAKTLLDSSNASYEKFISDWTEKQKTSDEIAEILYGDEKEAADEVKKYWEEVGDSLNTKLEQMGIEVPEGFFDIGTDSAENFAKGFKQTIETALNDITKTINSVSASVTPQFSAQLGDTGYTAPDATRVYNYYLVPSSDSVRDQIEEIQKFDERKKLKGD